MKINHKLIRDILKWTTFTIFAISVFIKLKSIIKYGGTTPIKDPNESTLSYTNDEDNMKSVPDVYADGDFEAEPEAEAASD